MLTRRAKASFLRLRASGGSVAWTQTDKRTGKNCDG